MFRTFIIATALAAPIAAHAAPITIMGGGVGMVCSDYLSEPQDTWLHAAHEQWAFGYLSGMSMGSGYDILDPITPKVLRNMVRIQCAYKPAQTLSVAVQTLFVNLDKGRS